MKNITKQNGKKDSSSEKIQWELSGSEIKINGTAIQEESWSSHICLALPSNGNNLFKVWILSKKKKKKKKNFPIEASKTNLNGSLCCHVSEVSSSPVSKYLAFSHNILHTSSRETKRPLFESNFPNVQLNSCSPRLEQQHPFKPAYQNQETMFMNSLSSSSSARELSWI